MGVVNSGRLRIILYNKEGKWMTEEYLRIERMQERIIELRGRFSFDIEEWQDTPDPLMVGGRWVRLARNEEAE